MSQIILTLPYPPSGNHSVKHARGGHYLGLSTKTFRRDVRMLALHYGVGDADLAGPLSVTYRFAPPDDRHRDSCNVIKSLKDALTLAGVWIDDSNRVIRRELIEWLPKQKIGEVTVTIEPFIRNELHQ